MSQTTETKAEANARRQREYRARKRAEMGDDAYLDARRVYRRDLTVRKREEREAAQPAPIVQPVQAPEGYGKSIQDKLDEVVRLLNDMEKSPENQVRINELLTELPEDVVKIVGQKSCADLVKKIKAEGGGDKSQQVRSAGLVYEYIFNAKPQSFNCKDFEWLRDVEGVIEKINNHPTWAESSKNTKRSHITAVLRKLKGFEAEHARAVPIITKQGKEFKEQYQSNKLSDSQAKNYLPHVELQKHLDHYPEGTAENALMSIYVDRPPRRLLDYKLMKVIRGDKNIRAGNVEKLSTDYNYVVLDKQNVPKTFIFNVYKTFKNYGRQPKNITERNINKTIAKKLGTYIKDQGLTNGQYLFSKRRDHSAPVSDFSKYISQTFKKATGKGVTVNLIRHAFITHALKSKLTTAEKIKLAEEMAHSIEMQDQYKVLDEPETDASEEAEIAKLPKQAPPPKPSQPKPAPKPAAKSVIVPAAKLHSQPVSPTKQGRITRSMARLS